MDERGRPLLVKVVLREGAALDAIDLSKFRHKWVDGKADVFMNARNLGDALVKDVAGKRPLMWIDGDRATIQKAADVFNNRADMVEKGTYPFMEKDYPTVCTWVALLAGSHVSDETVY